MKENLKKIGKYLLILLLLISGLAVLAMLFLFFVPSASLFGISYTSGNKFYYSKSYSMENYSIAEVKLVNSSYPVRVINSSDKNISVKVFDNTFGYVLAKNKKVNIGSKLNSTLNNYQLVFTIDEPHGFAYKSDSYIELRLPKNCELSLAVSSNSAGASIKLDKSTKISNFTYSAKRGTINLTNGKISNLDLTLNNCDFNVGKDFDLTDANLSLSLGAGNFNCYDNTSSLGHVEVQNLTSGRISLNNCKEIEADLKDAGGKLSIKNLNGLATIKSADTQIAIENVLASGGNLTLTKSGSVTLSNVNGKLSATTESGNITIAKTTAPLILSSKSGNINVKSAKVSAQNVDNAPIEITNTDGNINLNYATDDENANCWAEITNHNGRTTVNDVKRLDLTITGSGRAEINYNKVVGISFLNANSTGSILVRTPSNIDLPEESLNKYTLITESDKGTVSIALTQTTDLDSSLGDTDTSKHSTYVGTKEKDPSGQEWKDNVINIYTYSGSLTVRNR